MKTLDELFIEIEKHHQAEFCVDETEIDRLEESLGYPLPTDLKAFYRRYKCVKLFVRRNDPIYRFVPITEMHSTRIDIYGKDDDEWGPRNWITLVDVLDGNYIAIDVASKSGDEYNYIDCFHETFPIPGECKIIAKTFTELLEATLQENDNWFYVKKDFKGYGDGMPLTAENASLRVEGPGVSRPGWQVTFSLPSAGYNDFFADEDYGGKEKSFEAVKQFVEEKRNLEAQK